MSETTPTENAAPSLIDLYGMKVYAHAFFPDDYFAFIPATGGFVPQDTSKHPLFGLIRDDQEVSEKPYSVADHVIKLSDIVTDYYLDDFFIDEGRFFDDGFAEAIEDALKIAKLRAFEEQFLGKHISTDPVTVTTTNTVTPAATTSAHDILADITRIWEETTAAKRKQDMDLIRACLTAGMNVTVSGAAQKPILTVPEHMRDAYEAVAKERIDTHLGNLNARWPA